MSGLIQNRKKEYLICKMPEDRGVFPGQWAIPGGGIDQEETMGDALKREIMEEVGLEVERFEPFYFRDDVREKLKDGVKEKVYMIYLIFKVWVDDDRVKLSLEFSECAWVKPKAALRYDLNEPTRETFVKLQATSDK